MKDVLTDGVRGMCKSLMYANSVMLVGESMKDAMGVYEEWKKALGDKGWKIDVGPRECLCQRK